MTSKAAKRRAKKARITLPGGDEIPQRAKQGRRTDLERAEDARRKPLEARLRIAGIPATPDTLRAAVAPAFGHDVGLCINATVKGDEAAKAWDAFMHLSASYRNYMAFYVGQTGSPQCAAIAMIPEPMETDPSLRVDLRSHDEKVRAAKASWAAWEKRIADLPFPQMRWAINGTLRGFMGEGILWRDAKPTDTGRTVVAALRAMVA
jgi:hypothetical protein